MSGGWTVARRAGLTTHAFNRDHVQAATRNGATVYVYMIGRDKPIRVQKDSVNEASQLAEFLVGKNQ